MRRRYNFQTLATSIVPSWRSYPIVTKSWSSSFWKRSYRSLYPSATSSHVYQSHYISLNKSHYSTSVNDNSAVPIAQLSESFINGTSASYIDEMYLSWTKDPSSVHKSWDVYFRNVNANVPPGKAVQFPPNISGLGSVQSPVSSSGPSVSSTGSASEDDIRNSMRVLLLIRAYQVRGHLQAKLDPLTGGPVSKHVPPELLPETYGFTEADLDKPIFLGETHLISGFLRQQTNTLRALLERLRQTYCGTMGVEYMHIADREECNWIRERLETPVHYSFTKEDRLNILDRLSWSSLFENFLATKYSNVKRFGLQGCEVLIPGMKSMIDRAAQLKAESVVIGMPHRGRLNVLANVVRKPLLAILNEFNSEADQFDDLGLGTGDVKYHLGTSYDRPTRHGHNVHLTLVANPSHLEAVNPVVLGKVRAKQNYSNDTSCTKTIPVLIHGDAAFCGQGVSYETFDMCLMKDYYVGGCIHIIVNNQIGFTTDTITDRVDHASRYPTDVGKTAGAPIFHVNGDDPEAVVHVMNLAVEYRQAFKKDVVVDIFCYRKEGHNEMDEPSYTQPLMYKAIRKHKPVLQTYADRLIKEGACTPEIFAAMKDKVLEEYNRFYNERSQFKSSQEWLSSKWTGIKTANEISPIRCTGISEKVARQIGQAISTPPKNFNVHKKLLPALAKKKEMFDKPEEGLDWATAEALAFGSLLNEGILVRLSGQDVQRGTFSQRHSVLHDTETNATYIPINNINEKQQKFQVSNSSLSEFGVLGFELGFSLENPNALVMWEAQFGDFANGAQVIFDQFISSGEQKWLRQSGLVVLLPHGYDGQGPEHSSGRMERFLQMVDQDPDVFPDMAEDHRRQIQMSNMQIVNCSTPANYYHVLRRQIHRDFRKPLLVFTPKRLLKLKECASPLSHFLDGTRFLRIIPEVEEGLVSDEKIRKVIFCSGNVYYDLAEERKTKGIKDVAIVRIEQLAPVPFDRIEQQGLKYSKAQVVWCQEEPKNMGAWSWMEPNLKTALRSSRGDNVKIQYVGRKPSASPATGSYKTHKRQVKDFIEKSFL